MIPTLYHYSHCPFCIRVRMAAGFLNIFYDSKLLPYEDEEIPLKLIGEKMLPIWVDESGKAIGESIDIIEKIDTHNIFKIKSFIPSEKWSKLEEELLSLGTLVHNLAMPHWIYTKEFNESSRNYFQKKKEVKRGPFGNLIKNKDQYEKEVLNKLLIFREKLNPFYLSKEMGLFDILIAAHIWGLYVVPEFQFPEKIHNYLQNVKKLTHFNYQEDLWK